DHATNTVRHYQLDALRTPVAMTDAAGNTVTATTFDAWGNPTQQTAAGATTIPWSVPQYNPRTTGQAALLNNDSQSIGFTGYQKDTATGLYYAGARFYDPMIGGFNGMDPLFGSTEVPTSQHRYLYAMANPTRYTDPSGKCAEPASFLLCAALAGVIVGEGSYISDQLWGTEEEQEAAVGRAVFRGGLTTAAIAAPQMIAGAAATGTAVVSQTVSHGARYALAANAEALTAQTFVAAEVGVGLTGAMTPLAPATPTASMLGSMARVEAAEARALAANARIVASDVPTPPASVTWRIAEGADGNSVAVPVVNGLVRRDAATSATGFRVTVEGEISGGRGLGANQTVDRVAHEYAGAVQQANRILETNRAPVTAWERIYRRYQARGERPPEYVRGNALQQVADDLMRQNRYAQDVRIIVNRQSRVDSLRPLRPDVQVPTSATTQGVIDITTPKAAPKIKKYEDPGNEALINILYEQQ
ncbi:MAG: RHS domain-containing protein, partial [Xanthomonadales bacterium]|nr:RHS domain-containing protein [Xanthomonadales bacterium]